MAKMIKQRKQSMSTSAKGTSLKSERAGLSLFGRRVTNR
jgi:hypothetical protein